MSRLTQIIEKGHDWLLANTERRVLVRRRTFDSALFVLGGCDKGHDQGVVCLPVGHDRLPLITSDRWDVLATFETREAYLKALEDLV